MKYPLLASPRRIILLATLVLTSTHVSAQTIAYEDFSGYKRDLNMGAPGQDAPPASTGLSAYSVDNVHVDLKVRADSLIYGALDTSGDKLEAAGGGIWLTGLYDTRASGPFADYINGGLIGSADNTTLWLSLLVRLSDPASSSGQAVVALADSSASRLSMGQGWGQAIFQHSGDTPLDSETHLYVVRFEFKPGNDTATIWFDPELDTPIESQPATATANGNYAFDRIRVVGQEKALFVDEIRFGASATSVVPTLDTFTLNLGAGANGSVQAFPALSSYTLGAEVRIEAESAFGYAFKEWQGDVPAGMENTNPLWLTMDQARTLTAVFEAGVPGFFNFDPGADPYTSQSAFDLRYLNETRAGQDGFVTRDGDKFILGNGEPVRFWAATTGVPSGSDLPAMVRFLAKRGVNLVRWHTSLFNNAAPNMGDVRSAAIDDVQRLVVAAREQGIYTKLSHFFILGLRIQAGWGIEGYTSSWIAANPGLADRAPFGLIFFDEDFKNAYKNWTRELLVRPNPYDEDQTPLGQEPAVAIIEIQNEDNLFFNTFEPSSWPPVQTQKADRAFGDFLVAKYGSINAAISSWGGQLTQARDAIGQGRMTVLGAWHMTRDGVGASAVKKRRIADQIEFLTELQYGFYEEMKAFIRDDLGAPSLLTASNWHTADNAHLLDAEYYTYTAAGVLDSHKYFNAYISTKGVFTAVSGGDRFYTVPVVNNPRRSPVAYKQVEGHPSIISEMTWTLPIHYKSEGALTVAAYGALTDIDAIFWFATDAPSWQSGTRTWNFVSPALAGQFPAAALIYRRGDVEEADNAVVERRTVSNIASQEPAIIQESRGWDPTRDPTQEFDYDPNSGSGSVDPLAMLVGKVEIAFGSDADTVHPDLDAYIDYDARIVRSLNDQVATHWGQAKGINASNPTEGEGRLVVNTPRSQGLAGWLAHAGRVDLEDISIEMRNEWGTVVATSLDGLPLHRSGRILLQAGTREWLRGYLERPITLNSGGTSYRGSEIVSVGETPWQMEGIDATVWLRHHGSLTQARALDGNGYPMATLSADLDNGAVRFDLPGAALYSLLEFEPVTSSSYATWPAFTTAEKESGIGRPEVDADEDGFSNLEEYLFGSDPKDPTRRPFIEVAPVMDADVLFTATFEVRVNDPEHQFRVEVSRDLETWVSNSGENNVTVEATRQAGADGVDRITIEVLAPPQGDNWQFVRVAF